MKFADLMFVVLLDAMCTYNEGGITPSALNTVVYCHNIMLYVACLLKMHAQRIRNV